MTYELFTVLRDALRIVPHCGVVVVVVVVELSLQCGDIRRAADEGDEAAVACVGHIRARSAERRR